MKKNSDPIVLSGKVYVVDHLATGRTAGLSEYRLPDELKLGDVVVRSVLSERGRANRAAAIDATRRRAGRQARTAQRNGYSGFFVADIFDGETMRSFNVDAIVGGAGSYSTQKLRDIKIRDFIWEIEQRSGKVATYGNRAFELVDTSVSPAAKAARLAGLAGARAALNAASGHVSAEEQLQLF